METFKDILKIIIGIALIIGLHYLSIQGRGNGDVVEIGGKMYIKKVEYLGNDIYDTKYFPIDSLGKKSEKDLEVVK